MMIESEKETKISAELESCRTAIKREKELINYHKGLLKKNEGKEKAIIAKLDKLKMQSFIEMINKHGYDIDNLRNAVSVGDFTGVTAQKKASEVEKPTAVENKKNPSVQTEPTDKTEETTVKSDEDTD